MADPTTVEAAVSLQPAAAIRFLRGKSNVTTQRWTDLWQEAHTRAFMVAGAATRALVNDFREAVTKALEQGTTLAEFRKDFDGIVAKHGWVHNGTPGWRAQIIYETNLSMAYSAGRYEMMTAPDTLRVYPYWQYMHTSSARPRPEHLAWVGTTLRSDDPWWSTHFPPNGWRCKCSVLSVSAAGLKRQGKTGPDTAPPLDMRPWTSADGRVVTEVPKGIDPGFGYNPGAAWRGGIPEPVTPAPRAPRLPPADLPASVAPDYGDWARDVLTEGGRPNGNTRAIGELSPGTMHWLAGRGIAPEAPVVEITSKTLRHLRRDDKAKAGKAISLDEAMRLPELLAHPTAVLFGRQDGRVLTVFTPSGASPSQLGKIVVGLGLRHKQRSRDATLVRTVGIVPAAELRDPARYEVIEGDIDDDGT